MRTNLFSRLFSRTHLLFVMVIAAQMLVYNYPYLLRIEPRNHHAFRQYDCLAFAQSFSNGRASFFEPAVNNLGDEGSGKTAAEFPLFQWMVGNLWKVTGVHTIIYRLLNLAFLWLGLFMIYCLFLEQSGDKTFSALISGLVFTSPILSYYGVSVLSDVQAFSLSVTAFYLFSRWMREGSSGTLMWFAVTITLAGLLKMSSAAVLLLCLIWYLITIQQAPPENRPRRFRLLVSSLLVPVLSWLAWYIYARAYSLRHVDNFFLLGLLPVWSATGQELQEVVRTLSSITIPAFFNPAILVFLFVFVLIASMFLFRKFTAEVVMLLSAFAVFFGFIVLFFKALDVHDYYFLTMLSMLVVTLYFAFRIGSGIVKSGRRYVLAALWIFVLLGTFFSGVKTWKKINFNVHGWDNALVFNHREQHDYFWIYWLDRGIWADIERERPDLAERGVASTDTVLFLGDKTLNRALYLFGRVGYTSYNLQGGSAEDFVHKHREVNKVVVLDSALVRHNDVIPLLQNQVYSNGKMSVYTVVRP